MKTKTFKKIFRDKNKLKKMFTLYQSGWTTVALAKKFGCDHSSIIYQTQKITGIGKTKDKNHKTHITKPKRRIGKDKCPACELLLVSQYYCENCKPFKKTE